MVSTSQNNVMKFGIIGAGMIGHFHAKAITAMTRGNSPLGF